MDQSQIGAADVRAIAFYLPQFHPIPENDAWWGKGFTEWTNVTRARPNYDGHYQPHLPADLGFYDLRLPEVRQQQAELARAYGMYGFCYYYYWFSGKKLLQRPLEEMLATGKPDFPFCLCWANENWTRRWDGFDEDILIAQHYTPEDYRRLLRDLLPALRDQRYIRVNGKPLLLVYRPGIIPDARALTDIWRAEARQAGLGELYLCAVRAIEGDDQTEIKPTDLGFDAGVIFPPSGCTLPNRNGQVELFNPLYEGYIVDYKEYAAANSVLPVTDYPLFGGVMPSWDNTARRKDSSWIFHGATPELYQAWLGRITQQTIDRYVGDERLLFINAWNEWAEGAHLEPDQRFGHRWLAATRDGLRRLPPAPVATTDTASMQVEHQNWQERVNSLTDWLRLQESAIAKLRQANSELVKSHTELQEALRAREASLDAIAGSKAWRVAEAIWKVRRLFSRGRG